VPSAGFEPTIPADERPQTHAIDRAAIGTDHFQWLLFNKITFVHSSALVGFLHILYVSKGHWILICPICDITFKTVISLFQNNGHSHVNLPLGYYFDFEFLSQ
jgi:hypothetical protein